MILNFSQDGRTNARHDAWGLDWYAGPPQPRREEDEEQEASKWGTPGWFGACRGDWDRLLDLSCRHCVSPARTIKGVAVSGRLGRLVDFSLRITDRFSHPKPSFPLFFLPSASHLLCAHRRRGLLFASAQVSGLRDTTGDSKEKIFQCWHMHLQVQEIILDHYQVFLVDAPEFPAGSAGNAKQSSNILHFNNGKKVAKTMPWRSVEEVRFNVTGGLDRWSLPLAQGMYQHGAARFNSRFQQIWHPQSLLLYYHLTNFYQKPQTIRQVLQHSGNLPGIAPSLPWRRWGTAIVHPFTTGHWPCHQWRRKPTTHAASRQNSVFNDTFYSPILLDVVGSNANSSTARDAEMKTDISWESDKALYGQSKYSANWSQVAVLPNWQLRYPNGYSDAAFPRSGKRWAVPGLDASWRASRLSAKLTQRNDTTTMVVSGRYSVDIDHRMSSFFPSTPHHPLLNY